MNIERVVMLGVMMAGLGWAGTARGDVIELRNGTKVKGTLRREGETTMVITTELGVRMAVEREDVMRVTLLPQLTPMEVAEADWRMASVRIRKAMTIEEAIGICEKFVADHPKASEPVTKVLEGYRKLEGEDAVNFRGRWMTRGHMEMTKQEDAEAAWEAVDLYRTGRAQEALEAAQKALKEDPENPDALCVAGLAAYRLGAPGGAKGYFRRAVEVDGGNVLALNNAAVVCCEHGQQAEGLGYYLRALAAGPGNPVVLDNAMEAMHAYRGAATAAVYANVALVLDQAEGPMEAQMAKVGLVRYGSRWVDPVTAGRLAAQKAGILNAMGALDGQYRGALMAELADERRLLTDLADSAWGVPGNYYEEYVQEARSRLGMMVASMRDDAQRLQKELAGAEKQEFPGVQRLMEVEAGR